MHSYYQPSITSRGDAEKRESSKGSLDLSPRRLTKIRSKISGKILGEAKSNSWQPKKIQPRPKIFQKLSEAKKSDTKTDRGAVMKTMVGERKMLEVSIPIPALVPDYEGNGEEERRSFVATKRNSPKSKNVWNRLEIAEMENDGMRKNLNAMSSEISSLTEKLTYNRNEVLDKERKLQMLEKTLFKHEGEKKKLEEQLQCMHKKLDMAGSTSQLKSLEEECARLKMRNKDLEETVKTLELSKSSKASMKYESALRTAKETIRDLEQEMNSAVREKNEISREISILRERLNDTIECKNRDIEALQQNSECPEASQLLIAQLEALRIERDCMAKHISQITADNEEMKANLAEMTTRTKTFEDLVSALREALREERDARCRVDRECTSYNRKLKTFQMETSHTIEKLHRALHEREKELQKYTKKENNASYASASSASEEGMLNDAGNRNFDSVSSEKVQILTQTLLTKQGQIENLLMDNRKMKLVMDKMERKFKKDLLLIQNTEALKKIQLTHNPRDSTYVSKIAISIGSIMNRCPVIKIFALIYMGILHLWVLAILVTYIPEETFKFENFPFRKSS